MLYIIMPVYNTEKYLDEAVGSLLNQSLSFEKYVMLHLVDDASGDGSYQICEAYRRRYPDNILVTRFERNHGVSFARNYALHHPSLRPDMIVGFMDSDDRLKEDALERVADFMDRYPDVNIAVSEIHYFGAQNAPSKLNGRFLEREVVDIQKDYRFPQYYIGGVFLRRDAMHRIHFNENMRYWEDALAVNQVILQQRKYGLARGAVYYYRKRKDATSLVDRSWRDPDRYSAFLREGYLGLMRYCRTRKGKILPYVQYVVAYHMRLFMMKSKSGILEEMMSPEQMSAFRRHVRKILRKIRPEIIVRIPTSLPIVEEMLSLRQGRPVRAKQIYTEDDCVFTLHGFEMGRLSQRNVKLIRRLRKKDSKKLAGMLWGRFDTPLYQMRETDYIFAEHDGQRIRARRYPCHKELYILGDKLRDYSYCGFAIDIPPHWERARFGIHTRGIDIRMEELDLRDAVSRPKREGARR